MEKYLEIRWGKSSSERYPKSLELARKFSDFTEMNENVSYNVIKTDAQEIYCKYASYFEDFYSIIYGWGSVKIMYNGNQIEKSNFFYPFHDMVRCSSEHDKSANNEKFCSLSDNEEGWGCKFLKKIYRHFESGYNNTKGEYWYHYGSFEAEKNW